MFSAVQEKRSLSRLLKHQFYESCKTDIFPNMVLVKNVKFLHPFFLGKIGLQEVFGAVLDRKEAILDYKNIDL